ncbi:MAG: pyruvoyl-dependent arginine decarboxylase [Promethearchaeota archaeon]
MTEIKLEIAWGTGTGSSHITAFDNALGAAGIRNLNIIRLSSVIPYKATVHEVSKFRRKFTIGSICYSVMARIEAKAEWVAAGLGWSLAEEGGVFVERESENRASTVDKWLREDLKTLRENREWNWENELHTRTVEEQGSNEIFAGALVAAIYEIRLVEGVDALTIADI